MTFRQEIAGVLGKSWAQVNPSIYSLCFTVQVLGTKNWCSTCQTQDQDRDQVWQRTYFSGTFFQLTPEQEIDWKAFSLMAMIPTLLKLEILSRLSLFLSRDTQLPCEVRK